MARYTYRGQTLFSISRASSGFVTSFVDPRKTASRNVHLTTVQVPGGLSSHITDNRRRETRRVPVATTDVKELERVLKRIMPYFQRYRSNMVALRLPPVLLRIMAEARGAAGPQGKEIPIERWISMTKNQDMKSPRAWKKVRLSDLAKAERFGLKIDRHGVFWIVAFDNGWMLKLTPRRMENFIKGVQHAAGFGFNELVSYIEQLV